MVKQINHIAIVVKSVEQASEFYRSCLQVPVLDMGTKGGLRGNAAELGNAKIELLQPIDSGGLIGNFLDKHGEGFHHVCFQVDDLDSEIEFLKARGIRVIGQPLEGMDGRVIFLHPKSTNGLLIELVQKR
jgi:methylmalonyl-CoA epimerase